MRPLTRCPYGQFPADRIRARQDAAGFQRHARIALHAKAIAHHVIGFLEGRFYVAEALRPARRNISRRGIVQQWRPCRAVLDSASPKPGNGSYSTSATSSASSARTRSDATTIATGSPTYLTTSRSQWILRAGQQRRDADHIPGSSADSAKYRQGKKRRPRRVRRALRSGRFCEFARERESCAIWPRAKFPAGADHRRNLPGHAGDGGLRDAAPAPPSSLPPFSTLPKAIGFCDCLHDV